MNFIQSRTKAEKLKRWDCQRRGELQSGYKKMSFCWVFSRLHERERERETNEMVKRDDNDDDDEEDGSFVHACICIFLYHVKKKNKAFQSPFFFAFYTLPPRSVVLLLLWRPPSRTAPAFSSLATLHYTLFLPQLEQHLHQHVMPPPNEKKMHHFS